jgi:SAM-dependent methyltransferase
MKSLLHLSAVLWFTACASLTLAAEGDQVFQPTVGQAGRDVVWVPTPPALVEKMLDVAKVTASDFVMDLGSGDGRNVIAAARRGARARGVEFNADMVALSQRLAEKAGVGDKAEFVQGDMYVADISQASVLAIFLLPENMDKLVNNFLAMKPGSRIVSNTFAATGWEADESGRSDGDCGSWCNWLLWYVPARAEGRWRLAGGELKLEQKFQMLTGTLTVNGATHDVQKGRLRGEEITFTAGGQQYTGRVGGDTMVGSGWNATRVK